MAETDVARWIILFCVAPIILGGLLVTDGIFGVVLFLNLRALRAAKDWASTRGTIIASKIKILGMRSRGGRTQTNIPVVEYSYQVGGQSYQNDKLYAGHAFGGDKKRVTEKFLEQYPEGGSVEVFYNPNKPAESALHKNNPNVRDIAVILVIVNLAFCGVIPIFWFAVGMVSP